MQGKKEKSYIEVYVWPSDLSDLSNFDPGHASMKVHTSDGREEYLSFWPAERGGSSKAVKAKCHTLQQDVQAEGNKQPGGIYRLDIDDKSAPEIIETIKAIKTNINQYSYTLMNTGSDKKYNCSGMTEHVISTHTPIKFGDVEGSFPNRTAFILRNQKGVERVQETEEMLKALKVDTPRSRL